jgi:hypothetical protein
MPSLGGFVGSREVGSSEVVGGAGWDGSLDVTRTNLNPRRGRGKHRTARQLKITAKRTYTCCFSTSNYMCTYQLLNARLRVYGAPVY